MLGLYCIYFLEYVCIFLCTSSFDFPNILNLGAIMLYRVFCYGFRSQNNNELSNSVIPKFLTSSMHFGFK